MKQEEKEAILEYLIQFSNIEKRYPLFQGNRDPGAVAEFIGLDYDYFSKIRKNFDDQVRQAAEEILKEEEMMKQIGKLPFSPGETIAVVGDSITDDRQSWFQVFRNVLDKAVSESNFSYVDASLADSLSADVLRRIERDVFAHKPDWVFVALGSQDALRLHITTGRTLVSLAEFWENLNAIESTILKNCPNLPVWITPPPVITELMQKMPLHDGIIEEEDLKYFREVVAGKSGYVVDPAGTRMGDPPKAWNYMNDGFHPSLAGNMETVRCILKTCSGSHQEQKNVTPDN